MPITMNFKNNGTLLDLSGQDPNLTDADITEEFKASIKAQGDLRALNLSNNALSPSKLVELADWLIQNTKIRQFDVSNNTGKNAEVTYRVKPMLAENDATLEPNTFYIKKNKTSFLSDIKALFSGTDNTSFSYIMFGQDKATELKTDDEDLRSALKTISSEGTTYEKLDALFVDLKALKSESDYTTFENQHALDLLKIEKKKRPTARTSSSATEVNLLLTKKNKLEQKWSIEELAKDITDGTTLNLSDKNLYDYDIEQLHRFFQEESKKADGFFSVYPKLSVINLSKNHLTILTVYRLSMEWSSDTSSISEIDLSENPIEVNDAAILAKMLKKYPRMIQCPVPEDKIIETFGFDDKIKPQIIDNKEVIANLAGTLFFIYKEAFLSEVYQLASINITFPPRNATYQECKQFYSRLGKDYSSADELVRLFLQENLRQETEKWCVENNVQYQQNWVSVIQPILLAALPQESASTAITSRSLDRLEKNLGNLLFPQVFRYEMDNFFKKIGDTKSFSQVIEESLGMCAYIFYTAGRLLPSFEKADKDAQKNTWDLVSSFLNPCTSYAQGKSESAEMKVGRVIFEQVFQKLFRTYIEKRSINNPKEVTSLKEILEDFIENPPANDPVIREEYEEIIRVISGNIITDESTRASFYNSTHSVTEHEDRLQRFLANKFLDKSEYYVEQSKRYRQQLDAVNAQPEESRNKIEQKFIRKELFKAVEAKPKEQRDEFEQKFHTEEKIKAGLLKVKSKITSGFWYSAVNFFLPTSWRDAIYPEPPKLEKLYHEINDSTEYKNPHEYVRKAQLIVKGTEYLHAFDESIKDEEIELDNIGYAAARIAYLYHDELIKILEDRDSYTQLRVIDLPKKSDNIDDYIKFYAQLKNSKDAFMLVGHFNLNLNKNEYKPLDTKKYNEKCGTWKQKIKNISVVASFDFSSLFSENKKMLDLSSKKFDDINIQELLAYLSQNHDIKIIQFKAIDGLHASILIDAISDLGHAIELSFEGSILDENAQGRIDTLKAGSSTADMMVVAPDLMPSSLGEDGKGVYGRINSDDHTGSLSAQNLANLIPAKKGHDDLSKPDTNRDVSGYTVRTDQETQSLEDVESIKADSPPSDEEHLLSGRITPASH